MIKILHKHHIVPRYRCKELDINPNFIENLVDVTREQHAMIHWGYYCKDLTELLKYCNPPQWVLDMIPLGDGRDIYAAKLISKNEINEINISGSKNPMWGKKHSKETLKKIRDSQRLHYDIYGGTPCSEETKRKISEANMGNTWNKGKKRNPESIRKTAEANTGKKRSEETKRKLSILRTGKKHTKETKRKMSIARTGKKHTKEAKRKMSIASIGKKHTKETNRKLSIAKTVWHAKTSDYSHLVNVSCSKNPMWGKKHSKETLKKMSIARKAWHTKTSDYSNLDDFFA